MIASAWVSGHERPIRARIATWELAFADQSGRRFAEMASADIRLEGSVLPTAITGRESVFSAMRASASLYTRLAFVYETVSPDRTYMEWEAEAFGLAISGLTALTIDSRGWLTRIGLHHRPRGAVERFSAELGLLLS